MNSNKNQGLTLIEMILILMLLAIGMSILYRAYFIYTEKAVLTKTDERILIIENAMKFYKLDNGFYPSTEQGIAALVIKPTTEPIPKHWTPYLAEMPVDPRGKPYDYINPGKHHEIDIWDKP